MKKINQILCLAVLLLIWNCNDDNSDSSISPEESLLATDAITGDATFSEGTETTIGEGNNTGNSQDSSGLITAGEWNDLDNWTFWNNLIGGQDYADKSDYWTIYTNNRISVLVKTGNSPVANVKVELKENGNIIWESRTDNFGKAELWVGLFDKSIAVDLNNITLFINNLQVVEPLIFAEEGTNEFQIDLVQDEFNQIELAFIVDATGSMADELEFLKNDLGNVIQRVQSSNSILNILTSTVFYRDQGDDYVVKHSGFTNEANSTLAFIQNQSANGGGDFPEAVHTALNTALTELQWSETAKTRIAFLLLDAPPHYEPEVIQELHNSIKTFAKQGIKLIPITASGIDKESEFLMRFFAISTNGTYVFITNDSGIGNDHLEASVGDYEVEFLNDLMVRLIEKYSK